MTEQEIRDAVEAGAAQYWADSRKQGEAFGVWRDSDFAGDCPQIMNGSIVEYVTRSLVAAMPQVKAPVTIAELEAILNSQDDRPITINPDGSIGA